MSRIILGLEPSETGRWLVAVDPSTTKIEVKANQALVDRVFDFTAGALTAQGGWAVGALVTVGAIVWLVDRRLGQISKNVNVLGTIASVGKAWQDTNEILKEIRDNSRSSRANTEQILAKIEKNQRGLEGLYKKTKEVKEVSLAQGEELSGQLHQMQDKLTRAKSEVQSN